MLFVLLPFLAFCAFFLVRVGRRSEWPGVDPRTDFVAALLLWGLTLVAGTEMLSAVGGVARGPLAGLWATATVAALAIGGGWTTVRRCARRLLEALRGISRPEALALAGAVCLSTILFLIALISPPNNVDSLNVHMVRVVHWAQNQSLAQYPAGGISQLTRPPLAEVAMLNLRLLYGSDRPVALVQWFSFAAILVVVSGIAARLGAGRRGQLVAVAFAASLPMAILEASNTKNDLVVSLWVVCLAYYAVESSYRPLRLGETLLAGAAFGLGLLTKGTFLPAGIPLAIWLAVNLARRTPPRTAVISIVVLLMIALALNLRYWTANVGSFGTPFGTIQQMMRALELDELLVPADRMGPGLQVSGPQTPGEGRSIGSWFLSRGASLLALHTVFPEIGLPVRRALAEVPGLFEPGFLNSLEEGLWNHEDSAGNLLHLGLILAASFGVFPRAARLRVRAGPIYLAAAWAGWAGLTLITASIDLWAIRYQMAFFFLMAPMVGAVVSSIPRPALSMVLAYFLLLTSLPYALMNNTRPLLGAPPRTRSASILVTSPADILFVSTPEIEDQYRQATSRLEASSCRLVGLRLGPRDLEYSLWWLLDAPQSGFRLTTMPAAGGRPQVPGIATECAVLCTVCAGLPQYEGIPLVYDGGFLRLYLSEDR